MDKRKNIVVNKFSSYAAEQVADDLYYANLSESERIKEFLSILQSLETNEGKIERVIKTYPLGTKF